MICCDYCGKNIDDVPFKCHRCTGHYCSKHHLPEDHNCPGLEKEKSKNQERWKNAFVETFSNKKHIKELYYRSKQDKDFHTRKQNPLTKLKYFFVYKAKDFGNWLNSREHHRYNFNRRLNYLLGIIIPLAISIIAYVIFYTNAQKLNEINLWIIKLGGVLILLSIFFMIKYGIRFIKELINLLKRQTNWLKYLIIILLIFLLWQAYNNKETVLDPVFNFYNQTNFSLFIPIGGINISSDGSNSNNYIPIISDVKDAITPKPKDISIIEMEVHRLVNEQRTSHGLSALSWDSKLSDIARSHSQDMLNNNFFDHTNLRGEDPTARADKVGYSCYKDYGSYYTMGIAENIGGAPFGDVSGCGYVGSEQSVAKCLVEGWMGSLGHRENILTASYDSEGIGVACDSSECLGTQNFC